MTSYWGSRKGLEFNQNYEGSVLLRYPVLGKMNTADAPAGQDTAQPVRQEPASPPPHNPAPEDGYSISPPAQPTAAVPNPISANADQPTAASADSPTTPADSTSPDTPLPEATSIPSAPVGGSCSAPAAGVRVLEGGWLLLGLTLVGLVLCRRFGQNARQTGTLSSSERD